MSPWVIVVFYPAPARRNLTRFKKDLSHFDFFTKLRRLVYGNRTVRFKLELRDWRAAKNQDACEGPPN